MDDIFSLLRAEGREHIGRITELLLSWESGEIDVEGLEELFRAAHSLKGSASTLGVDSVAAIAHEMEDVFGAVKRGEVKYDEAAGDEILAALDAIGAILETATAANVTEGLEEARAVAARVRRLLDTGASPKNPQESENAARGGRPAPADVRGAAKTPGAVAKTGLRTEETVRLPVEKLDAVIDGYSGLWEEKFRNDDFGARLDRVAAAARTASKLLDEALELFRRRADPGEFFHHVERIASAVGSVDREMRAVNFDFAAATRSNLAPKSSLRNFSSHNPE